VKRTSNDSSKLTYLNDLPYTAVELRQEAANRAKSYPFRELQPKLSAAISIVDQNLKLWTNLEPTL
jgi:serine/threonine-protein kinase HipA